MMEVTVTPKKLELIIPQQVHEKIMYWVHKSDLEVSGFGKIVFDEPNKQFTVTDVYLLEQEVGAAHTDIDAASLGRLMYETREIAGDLRFWWHSHVNMGVFWSGTDTETIKDLATHGWIVASVFNKKNEVRTAVGQKTITQVQGKFTDPTPRQEVQIMDELPTVILKPAPASHTQWDEEFDSKVKRRVHAPARLGTWVPGGWAKDPITGLEKYTAGYHDATIPDRGEALRRLGGSKTKSTGVQQLPLVITEEDLKPDEYYTMGYFGMGYRKEAKILGMRPKHYLRLLKEEDSEKLDIIDEALTRYLNALEEERQTTYEHQHATQAE